MYNRREFKIVTAFASLFTSYYIFHWKDYFPDTPLKYPPSFDGRAVLYPDSKNVRDYFAWRQADCASLTERVLMVGHINNLHNTTYWALVGKGMSEREATKRLEVYIWVEAINGRARRLQTRMRFFGRILGRIIPRSQLCLGRELSCISM